MLPHSFLFGHLIELGKLLASAPSDIHHQWIGVLMMKKHPEIAKAGLFYMDSWPIMMPMITVFNPDLMSQFTQEENAPKAQYLRTFIHPFTQNRDLVSQDGAEWKTWRSRFNPGFSARNMTALIPAMLEEVLDFRSWLSSVSNTDRVEILEERIVLMTIDVMGRTIL
jgi:cytochrome P450